MDHPRRANQTLSRARGPAQRSGGGDPDRAPRASLLGIEDHLPGRPPPSGCAIAGEAELVVVDGAPGLEKALAALWPDMANQRCTVHKHRNLLAHAPERLHEEISNDYKDMIYARTKPEVEARRKAFIRKWRLKCRAVADSLEEAGDKLFTFTRFPPSQWKSIRTSNAIERAACPILAIPYCARKCMAFLPGRKKYELPSSLSDLNVDDR